MSQTNSPASGHLRCKMPWAWEDPDPILHQRTFWLRWSISDLRYASARRGKMLMSHSSLEKDDNMNEHMNERTNEWTIKKEVWLGRYEDEWAVTVKGVWAGCGKKGDGLGREKRHPHFYIRLTHKHRQRSDTKGHIPLPFSISFSLISDPEEHGQSAVLLTWTPSASLPEETSTNT